MVAEAHRASIRTKRNRFHGLPRESCEINEEDEHVRQTVVLFWHIVLTKRYGLVACKCCKHVDVQFRSLFARKPLFHSGACFAFEMTASSVVMLTTFSQIHANASSRIHRPVWNS